MTTSNYTVASASQLTGLKPRKRAGSNVIDFAKMKTPERAMMDKNSLQRRTAARKSVRSSASSTAGDDEDGEASPGIFTHSRHASWSSQEGAEPVPVVQVIEEPEPATLELLKPVAYAPHQGSDGADTSIQSASSADSPGIVKERVLELEAQMTLPKLHQYRIERTKTDLAIDTEATGHSRSTSSSSRRSSGDMKIYFTPTDYTKSQIFLSSPRESPTLLPPDEAEIDDCPTPTPTATASMGRPRSEIHVGPLKSPKRPRPSTENKDALSITPLQLDQLVTALAKSQLIQKRVRRHWWDAEDIPDDDSFASFTSGSVSTPTLTSASTLYSRPNENFLCENRSTLIRQQILKDEFARNFPDHPNAKKPTSNPSEPLSFGGIILTDPRIHGSPIRYISKTYRHGTNIPRVGQCSFLNVPCGIEAECTLSVNPPSSLNSNSRVLLQCTNQAVDRKTGKKTYLLAVEIDVTGSFTKAALTQFAEATDRTYADISITNPADSPLPTESPDIDWIALADELQATAAQADLVDTAIEYFSHLTTDDCAMQTHTLLSELDRIKDQHTNFLILKPTAWHENGMPSIMRLPWVSQRLFRDWYETPEMVGVADAARAFQAIMVTKVAKGAISGERFTCHVPWQSRNGPPERLVVSCVPLSEGTQEGRGDAWACFVRGMFDI